MLTIHVLLKISNNDSANICSWFVDSKLSIPFGEEETKSILTKSNIKNPIESIRILKSNSVHKYFMNEPMDLKVISKLNRKLEFFLQVKSFFNT